MFIKTGKKGYNILKQYSSLTGLPTGIIKLNIPTDPDYVPPIVDIIECPIDEDADPDGNARLIIQLLGVNYTGKLSIKITDDTTSAIIYEKTWTRADISDPSIYINENILIPEALTENYKVSYIWNNLIIPLPDAYFKNTLKTFDTLAIPNNEDIDDAIAISSYTDLITIFGTDLHLQLSSQIITLEL